MSPVIYNINNAVLKEKMASFDFDWTLVCPKDGRTFPKNIEDWEWLYEGIKAKIKWYSNNGYMIVIFTNQSKEWKHSQIKNVMIMLEIPVFVVVATTKETYKPNPILLSSLLNGYNIVSIIISIIYICMCFVMTLYIILQPEARYNDTTSLSNYSSASSATPKSVASISSPNGTPNVISRISAFSQSPRTPSVSRTIVTRTQTATTKTDTNNASTKPQSPINNNNNTVNTHLIRLKDIFSNDYTFKLFIRHLSKEYCIENALFLFESQQFKKQCNSIELQLGSLLLNNASSKRTS